MPKRKTISIEQIHWVLLMRILLRKMMQNGFLDSDLVELNTYKKRKLLRQQYCCCLQCPVDELIGEYTDIDDS